MMKWVEVNDRKPEKSGVYEVKSTGLLYIKRAYYDTASNHWTYDDGFWLPFCVDACITHWKEIK